MPTELKKIFEQLVEDAIEEVNAISTGGGSMEPSGQVSGTGGNPLGRDMTDEYEMMWSGDSSAEKVKKDRSLKEDVVEEDDLEEFSAAGSGAVVGYSVPLGMEPDHETLGTNKEKKQNPQRWYDVKKENMEEEFLGTKGAVSYFQMGGSLPDKLYNLTDDGKPTRDPGVAGLKKKKKK